MFLQCFCFPFFLFVFVFKFFIVFVLFFFSPRGLFYNISVAIGSPLSLIPRSNATRKCYRRPPPAIYRFAFVLSCVDSCKLTLLIVWIVQLCVSTYECRADKFNSLIFCFSVNSSVDSVTLLSFVDFSFTFLFFVPVKFRYGHESCLIDSICYFSIVELCFRSFE